MNCDQATEILLTFVELPAQPHVEIATTLEHIAGCAVCQRRTVQLRAALRSSAEDMLTCAVCEPQLAEYLAAARIGHSNRFEWDAVRTHLVSCPHCIAALADLADLLNTAERPEATLQSAPTPRLDFLRSAEPALWRLDTLGRLVVDLARALRPAAPVAAGLKATTGTTRLEEATVSGALSDLELQISLEGRADDERRVMVVMVNILSRGGWPNLAGSEVSLIHNDVVVESQQTDAFGTVAFSGYSADELRRSVLVVRLSEI